MARNQSDVDSCSGRPPGLRIVVAFRRQASTLWLALIHMLDDGGTLLAGHVAFATLFALFPFLIFLTTLAGEFGQSGAAQAFIDLGLGAVPDEVRAAIEPAVSEVLTGGRQGLMTVSILLSLWAVSSAFEATRYALNLAYDVKRPRAIWWQRLQSMFMVLTFAFFIIIAMLIVVAAPFAWSLAEFFELEPAAWQTTYSFVRFGLSVFLMLCFVLPLYRWLPNRQLDMAEVLPGALLAVVIWMIVGSLYSWYLQNLGRFTVTYGSLGGIIATLVFFYITALILIFGAEFNAARRRRRGVALLGVAAN